MRFGDGSSTGTSNLGASADEATPSVTAQRLLGFIALTRTALPEVLTEQRCLQLWKRLKLTRPGNRPVARVSTLRVLPL